MRHYDNVFTYVAGELKARGEPATRRGVYNEIYERMMAHARYECERCLLIAFRRHQEVPGDHVVLVPQHDDQYLVPASTEHRLFPSMDKDMYMVVFQLQSRMHLNGPHSYTNGMGVRWIPGKVLRHQSHEVTARRALIRALQTYRLPSERHMGYWPFTDPRR